MLGVQSIHRHLGTHQRVFGSLRQPPFPCQCQESHIQELSPRPVAIHQDPAGQNKRCEAIGKDGEDELGELRGEWGEIGRYSFCGGEGGGEGRGELGERSYGGIPPQLREKYYLYVIFAFCIISHRITSSHYIITDHQSYRLARVSLPNR